MGDEFYFDIRSTLYWSEAIARVTSGIGGEPVFLTLEFPFSVDFPRGFAMLL